MFKGIFLVKPVPFKRSVLGLVVTVSLPGDLGKRTRIRHLMIPSQVTLESAVELEAEIQPQAGRQDSVQ